MKGDEIYTIENSKGNFELIKKFLNVEIPKPNKSDIQFAQMMLFWGIYDDYVYNACEDDADENTRKNAFEFFEMAMQAWTKAAQMATERGEELSEECVAFINGIENSVCDTPFYTSDVRKLFDAFFAETSVKALEKYHAHRTGLASVNNGVFRKDAMNQTKERNRQFAFRIIRLLERTDNYTVLHDAVVSRIFDFMRDGQISGNYVYFSAGQLFRALRGRSKNSDAGGIDDDERKNIDRLMTELETRVKVDIALEFQDRFQNTVSLEKGYPRMLEYIPIDGTINGAKDRIYTVRMDSFALVAMQVAGSVEAIDEKYIAIQEQKNGKWCQYLLTDKRLAVLYSLLNRIMERRRMMNAEKTTNTKYAYDDIIKDVQKVAHDKNEARLRSDVHKIISVVLNYWVYMGLIESWGEYVTQRGTTGVQIYFKQRQLESGESGVT